MLTLEAGALIDLEEKALSEDDDVVTISGYASTFGNVDLGGDVVVKGAFAESLEKRGLPLLLFQHKMDEAPLGPVLEAREDAKGLWFKAELPKDDAFNKGRVIPQLKRKGLKGVSIGFKVKAKSLKGGHRYIEKADLFEISLVNMPMNPRAAVESVKAQNIGVTDWSAYTDREREAHFKALGFSDELAKRFVRLDREGRERESKSRREAGEGMSGLPDVAATIRQFIK